MDLMQQAAFLMATGESGIDALERRGQSTVVNSCNFPRKSGGNLKPYERWGFVFGDHVDDLFVSVTLPAGWSKVASPDHHLWSYILDANGRRRVAIFYKAAFYDRDASASIEPRYRVECSYFRDKDPVVWVRATDGDVVLFETTFERGADDRAGYRRSEEVQAEVCAWLDEHRPGFEDAALSWDIEAP